jgi:hypothetical protein
MRFSDLKIGDIVKVHNSFFLVLDVDRGRTTYTWTYVDEHRSLRMPRVCEYRHRDDEWPEYEITCRL